MIYVYREQQETGDYCSANGERYMLASASVVLPPYGKTAEECGWILTESLEAAAESWDLTYNPLDI